MDLADPALPEFRPMTAAEIAQVVCSKRALLGWDTTTLAQCAGLLPAEIADLESGASAARETYRAVAHALGFEANIFYSAFVPTTETLHALAARRDALERRHLPADAPDGRTAGPTV